MLLPRLLLAQGERHSLRLSSSSSLPVPVPIDVGAGQIDFVALLIGQRRACSLSLAEQTVWLACGHRSLHTALAGMALVPVAAAQKQHTGWSRRPRPGQDPPAQEGLFGPQVHGYPLVGGGWRSAPWDPPMCTARRTQRRLQPLARSRAGLASRPNQVADSELRPWGSVMWNLAEGQQTQNSRPVSPPVDSGEVHLRARISALVTPTSTSRQQTAFQAQQQIPASSSSSVAASPNPGSHHRIALRADGHRH